MSLTEQRSTWWPHTKPSTCFLSATCISRVRYPCYMGNQQPIMSQHCDNRPIRGQNWNNPSIRSQHLNSVPIRRMNWNIRAIKTLQWNNQKHYWNNHQSEIGIWWSNLQIHSVLSAFDVRVFQFQSIWAGNIIQHNSTNIHVPHCKWITPKRGPYQRLNGMWMA